MQLTDLRKGALAWLVKTNTTVSNDWICKRLCMGHRTNVPNAKRAFQEGRNGEVKKLRRKLAGIVTLQSTDGLTPFRTD
jgi:hypothetical protein